MNDMTTTTFYITRYFTKGPLKGLYHQDTITLHDDRGALAWVEAINSPRSQLDYKIVEINGSFQNMSAVNPSGYTTK